MRVTARRLARAGLPGLLVLTVFLMFLTPGCARRGSDASDQRIPTTRDGAVTRLGPLSYRTGLSTATLSPDGRYLALAGFSGAKSEVWLLNLAAGEAYCCASRSWPSGSDRRKTFTLMPMSWVGDRLAFLVWGFQTAGPNQGESGCWIASVPSDGGAAETIAFIPGVYSPQEYVPVADGTAAVILFGGETHWVDLVSGQIHSLPTNLTGYVMDWTIRPSFSADGRHAVSGAELEIVDLRTGTTVRLQRRGEDATSYETLGWTAGGLIVQGAVAYGDSVRLGDFGMGYPAGYVGLRLLDVTGTAKHEVAAQGGQDWRIGWLAWAPEGDSLLLACGPMGRQTGSGGVEQPQVETKELWEWSAADGTYRILAGIDGRVHHIDWGAPGLCQVWYCQENGDTTRRGLEIRLDTAESIVSPRSVPTPFREVGDSALRPIKLPGIWGGMDRLLGECQGVPIVARFLGSGNWRVVAAGAEGDTVIRELSTSYADFRLCGSWLLVSYGPLGQSEYFIDVIALAP